MIKFLFGIIGDIMIVFSVIIAILFFFSSSDQEEQEEPKPTFWKDVLAEEGYSDEIISECEEILTNIGFYDLGKGSYRSQSLDETPPSIVISCFGSGEANAWVRFDVEGAIDYILFYSDFVYTKEEGQLATVNWEKRKLTYRDDYKSGMTVTLLG